VSLGADMRRRKFITLVGGAAAVWPLAARAQQAVKLRRIGVLMGQAENDPGNPSRVAAFEQALDKLGWSHGRTVVIEFRWGAGNQRNLANERSHGAVSSVF
jgi:putative ABC transport system substrate-binding protein